MDTRDAILLRLRRTYSESEICNYLLNELKKAEFKVGELLSEISELKHNAGIPYDWSIIKKDVRVTAHFKATKESRKKNILLQKELTIMRDKYFSLKAKYEP